MIEKLSRMSNSLVGHSHPVITVLQTVGTGCVQLRAGNAAWHRPQSAGSRTSRKNISVMNLLNSHGLSPKHQTFLSQYPSDRIDTLH